MCATQNKKLDSVYLVVGDDELKRCTVLERLKKYFDGDSFDFNNTRLNGTSSDGLEIINACKTLPFMSDKRLVVVEDADKLSKDSMTELLDYVNSPVETCILVLIADKFDKKLKLYKTIEGSNPKAVINCVTEKGRDLISVIVKLGQTYGIQLTDSAAKYLIDALGENTVTIDNELKKLSLSYGGDKRLTDRDLSHLITQVTEPKPYQYVNALCDKNLAEALSLLNQMPQSSPYYLISVSVNRMRELLCAQTLLQQGRGRDLARELSLVDWQVKNHARWASTWRADQLKYAIRQSCETEKAMKSGTDPFAALQDWVIRILSY